MATQIAQAFVLIRPDLKGFQAELRTKLASSLKGIGTPKVPVQPVLAKGSIAKLKEEILAVGGLRIPVTPVVGRAVSAAGGAGAAAAAAGQSALSAAEQKEADIAEKTRVARANVDQTFKLSLATIDDLAAAEQALAVADETIATAEALLEEAVKATNVVLERRFTTLANNARTAREALAQNVQTAEEQAAAEAAVAKQAELEAAATEALTAARAKLAAVDQAGRAALTQRQALSAKVTATDAALTAATNAVAVANETNNAELIRSAVEFEAQAKGALDSAKALAINAAATDAAAASTATLERGVGAGTLSLAGFKGATLAASKPFLIGAAAVTIFSKSLKEFAGFEETLNTFQAVAGATADQMTKVSETAVKLGNDLSLPGVSAQDAADAMTELSKAGLSVNQALSATRGVLQLATAANISNADAVRLVSDTLNAFNLNGNKATGVADAFANAANAAQGDVSSFGLALEQSAAVASKVGLSYKNTIALLALFAKNGLQGSDAGTSLRTALIRLINPTKRASDVIKELNLHIRDAQGNIRPDIFAQFGKATEGLTKAQQQQFAAILGGSDALRAFAIGAAAGERGLAKMQAQINKTGTASAVASARTKGLGGAIENMKNSASDLGITIGETFGPAFEKVLGVITDTLAGFGQLIKVLHAMIAPAHALAPLFNLLAKAIGAGLAPVLAALGIWKAFSKILSFVTATKKELITVTKSLISVQVIEGSTTAATAASMDELALGLTGVAAAEAEATIATGAFVATILPIVGAAALIGGAFLLLRKSTDNVTKATNDFSDALDKLSAKRTPHNLAEVQSTFRDVEKAIHDTNEAARKQFQTQSAPELKNLQLNLRAVTSQIQGLQRLQRQGLLGPAQAGQLKGLEEQQAGFEKAIANLRTIHTEQDVNARSAEQLKNKLNHILDGLTDPVAIHNVLLLRDFLAKVGKPTPLLVKFVFNNKDLALSLNDVLREAIKEGGPNAKAAGEELALRFAEGFIDGAQKELVDKFKKMIGPGKFLPPGLPKETGKDVAFEFSAGLRDAFAQAQISGDLQRELGVAKEQESAVQKRLNQELEKTGGVITKSVASLREKLAEAHSQVTSIQDQIAQAAQDAITTANTALQKQIDLLEATIKNRFDPLIKGLQARLNAMQAADQLRSITKGITDAEKALRDAQQSVQIVGAVTPRQRRDINTFLQGKVQDVQAARRQLTEFRLERRITQLQNQEQTLLDPLNRTARANESQTTLLREILAQLRKNAGVAPVGGLKGSGTTPGRGTSGNAAALTNIWAR